MKSILLSSLVFLCGCSMSMSVTMGGARTPGATAMARTEGSAVKDSRLPDGVNCPVFEMPTTELYPSPPIFTDDQASDADYVSNTMLDFFKRYRDAVLKREVLRRDAYNAYISNCLSLQKQNPTTPPVK